MNQIERDSRRRSRLGRALVATALGVALLGGLWFLIQPSPNRLLEQGLAIGRRNPAEGMRVLRRAIETAGGRYPDAELALCLLLANEGDWQAAESHFSTLDKGAVRADLLLALARTALQADRGSVAEEALESLRGRGTRDSAAALELLIDNYREWGRKEDMIAASRELIELKPGDPRPQALLIELLKSEVRRDVECLAAIRKALAHDPPDDFRRDLQHQLVEQLIICGDAAGARRELESLIASEGESFRVRTYEVDLCRLEGNLDLALETMSSLFPEVRDKAQARLNRGVIYLDMGRYEEAAADLERVVAVDRHNASAQFKLSEAYRGLGRNDLARRHREISAALSEKRGRIEMLLKQASREPQNRRIYEKLAELYRDVGENDAADRWEERAARL